MNRHDDERGAVAIIVALCAIVLFGAAALTHRQFDARFACPAPLAAMGEWRN